MRRPVGTRWGRDAAAALAPTAWLVLLGLVALTGCARTAELPLAPAPLQANWAGCRSVRPYVSDTESNQRIDSGALPPQFAPTALIRCASGTPGPDGAPGGLGAVEERSDQLTELLPVLTLPSQQPRGRVLCPGLDYRTPWLFLIDGDRRWITVAVPRNVCGSPRAEFSSVYDGLTFRTVRVT